MNIQKVASYFIYNALNEHDLTISNLKLQKLCYYSQAWNLAWYDEALFEENFQAWVHGPANNKLYTKYKKYGYNRIDDLDDNFNVNDLDDKTICHLNTIWNNYGKYDGKTLEKMTHNEDPWILTRGNVSPWEKCTKIIKKEVIKEYYKQFI